MIDTSEDDATILQCIADLQRAGLSANRGTIGHKLRRIRACHSWRVQAIDRLEASGHVDPGIYRGHAIENYTLTRKGWEAAGNAPLWVAA